MIEEKIEIFIFKDFEKYMNSSNRFKSYIISQLNNVKNIIKLENIFLNFKKELLPYLFDKKEVKVICNSNSYKIEIYDEMRDNEMSDNEMCDNEMRDNEMCDNESDSESDCSTVDLNINIHNNMEGINDNEDNYDDSNNQTYLLDSDESDEESLIEIAMSKVKLEDIKSSDLKKLSIYELRNILRSKELTISKNGVYLNKKELIKKLLNEKRKYKSNL